MKRRSLLKSALAAGMGAAVIPGKTMTASATGAAEGKTGSPKYNISLAEWSLRDWLRSGKISNLEFGETAKKEFGIEAVEYVSTFFEGKETDQSYLRELKKRTDDEGVRNVLIMVDMWGDGGAIASPDESKRKMAAQNHHKWVDTAKYLGCHAIRVNASGYGDAGYQDAKNWFADGLSRLVEYGKQNDVSITVENHGGHSSNGRWLVDVMKAVDDDYCGTLPDFGNFAVDREKGIFYDPLIGLSQIMPYAKGVSAKANQFDAWGNETTIDYPKMMRIVHTAGFEGFIGVEWGGGDYSNMKPEDGIRATKKLLQEIIAEF